MTEIQRCFVVFAVMGTGAVIIVLGAHVLADIVAHYRRNRIYEINRRKQ